jgi:hypothetical protein
VITGPKNCVWVSSISFSKRWIGPMADKEKKEGEKTFVMSAIRTHC